MQGNAESCERCQTYINVSEFSPCNKREHHWNMVTGIAIKPGYTYKMNGMKEWKNAFVHQNGFFPFFFFFLAYFKSLVSMLTVCFIFPKTINRTSEKVKKEREKERREQYKQVRAHVKKEDGRLQAYGWSLPAKFTPPREVSNRSHISVPVPVYCRPLYDDLVGVKVWLCVWTVNIYWSFPHATFVHLI